MLAEIRLDYAAFRQTQPITGAVCIETNIPTSPRSFSISLRLVGRAIYNNSFLCSPSSPGTCSSLAADDEVTELCSGTSNVSVAAGPTGRKHAIAFHMRLPPPSNGGSVASLPCTLTNDSMVNISYLLTATISKRHALFAQSHTCQTEVVIASAKGPAPAPAPPLRRAPSIASNAPSNLISMTGVNGSGGASNTCASAASFSSATSTAPVASPIPSTPTAYRYNMPLPPYLHTPSSLALPLGSPAGALTSSPPSTSQRHYRTPSAELFSRTPSLVDSASPPSPPSSMRMQQHQQQLFYQQQQQQHQQFFSTYGCVPPTPLSLYPTMSPPYTTRHDSAALQPPYVCLAPGEKLAFKLRPDDLSFEDVEDDHGGISAADADAFRMAEPSQLDMRSMSVGHMDEDVLSSVSSRSSNSRRYSRRSLKSPVAVTQITPEQEFDILIDEILNAL